MAWARVLQTVGQGRGLVANASPIKSRGDLADADRDRASLDPNRLALFHSPPQGTTLERRHRRRRNGVEMREKLG